MSKKKTENKEQSGAGAKKTKPDTWYELGRWLITADNLRSIEAHDFVDSDTLNFLLKKYSSLEIYATAHSGAALFDKWQSLIFEDIYFLTSAPPRLPVLLRDRIFYQPDGKPAEYTLSPAYPRGEVFLERRLHIFPDGTQLYENGMKIYSLPWWSTDFLMPYRAAMKIFTQLGSEKVMKDFCEKQGEVIKAVDQYARDYPNHRRLNMTILSQYLCESYITPNNIAHNRFYRIPWMRRVCEEYLADAQKRQQEEIFAKAKISRRKCKKK